MSEKYKFDPNTLSFSESESKIWTWIKRIVANLIVIIFIGFLVFIILSSFIKTPEEKKLIVENKKLKQEYTILTKRYEKLSINLQKLQKTDEIIYQAIFQSKPLKENKPDYDSIFVNTPLEDLISQNTEKIKNLLKDLKNKNNEFKKFIDTLNPERLKKIPSVLPIPLEFLARGFYGYGYKLDIIYKTVKAHTGVDFTAPEGTPVFATADGTVIYSRYDKKYGKNIIISHGNGFYTVYANLSEKLVSAGKKVKKGDLIGKVGNTGKSFIPHLHYEVKFKNKNLNPLYFFFGSINPKVFHYLSKESQLRAISLD